jgi:1-deoxy-D-xylulose-5-phosphate synthase
MSYLRHIPNLVFMAPKDEAELARMMVTAFALDGPVAVRYPRGTGVGADVDPEPEVIPVGQGEILRTGRDALVITLGSRVYPCMEAALELAEEGLEATVFNARFIKPLPEEMLRELMADHDRVLIVEENALPGGFGSGVLEFLNDHGLLDGRTVRRLGLPDAFVEHGTQKELRAIVGIDKQGIKGALKELVEP